MKSYRARGLLVVLMFSGAVSAAAPFAPMIPRECPEAIGDSLRDALGDLRLECAADAQVFGANPRINADHIAALGVDADSRVRALLTSDDPVLASVYTGSVADAGSDGGMIYWGSWSAGAGSFHDGSGAVLDERSRLPLLYVGGISSGIVFREDALVRRGAYGNGPIPVAGIADYRLLGGSKLYSTLSRGQGPWGVDIDGNDIATVPVTTASLKLDHGARRGTLELTYNLRGVAARQQIVLLQKRAPSTDFEALECAGVAEVHCPTAQLEFYGRQGEYAGVVLTVNTQTSMNEGARVAARLNEVRSHAVLAFKRQ